MQTWTAAAVAAVGLPSGLRKYAVESEPRRIALAAGNADYPEHIGRPPGALNDAQGTARTLVSLGFTLTHDPNQFRTRDDFLNDRLLPFVAGIKEGDFADQAGDIAVLDIPDAGLCIGCYADPIVLLGRPGALA